MQNLATHSISHVGDFIIMKTDYGEHTSRMWARTTVGQIVQMDHLISLERKILLLDIKHKMVEALEPYFFRSKNATFALGEILDIVRGSPWEQTFAHPGIKTQIFLCIERNLNTAWKG